MDLVFLIGVVWTLSQSVRSFFGRSNKGFQRGRNPDSRRKAEPTKGRTARDPVCGMFVSTEVSYRLKRGEETLHFCSQDCLERYEKKTAKA
jgi:YHS domain-containing protein